MHRQVLLPITVVFVGAVLFAVLAVAVILPLATTPASAFIPISALVLADLAILYFFLRHLLRSSILEPLAEIEGHAERITEGDLDHRIPAVGTRELDGFVHTVNHLAERLIAEKTLLAANVASLEETNQALSETSQELVRAARMASIGTLAAGVAHEIGNPLGAARGYLDVLEARVAVGRPVQEIVTELKTEVGRIDEIVRAILAFSRPLSDERTREHLEERARREDDAEKLEAAAAREAAGAGSGADPGWGAHGGWGAATGGRGKNGGKAAEALPPPFDGYEAIVDRVRADLERVRRLENVAVEVAMDPDVPAVHAHPQHLERILSNLCRNAAQALEGRSDARLRIRITTTPAVAPLIKPRRDSDPPTVNYAHRRRLHALLQVQGAPPPRRADRDMVMEVTDNGPGIPEHVIADIFDPFFTTREPGQGVGLGLALTARIVGELGGGVEAENRPEGGACFRVRIPGAATDPPEGMPASGEPADHEARG